jgi:hypothetical protein
MNFCGNSMNSRNSCEIKMGLYEPKDPECMRCQRAAKEVCQFYAYITDQKTKTEIIDSAHVIEFEEQ